MKPGALVRLYLAAVLTVAGGFFVYVFDERYWRWRHCFNDRGRCWDPVSEQVFVENAGLIWGGCAAICLLAAFAIMAWRGKT